jgi:hypothetical protein
MRIAIVPLLAGLLLTQTGCSGKPGTSSEDVSKILAGSWSTNLKDRDLTMIFAEDGTLTISFDQHPVRKDGSFQSVEPGKITGRYKLTDEKDLSLDFKPSGKETPTMKLPTPGSYKIEIVKERHKGIGKDGGPRFKDWTEYRLTLVNEKGEKWELSRETN